jgi:high-affinity iron transporter
VAGTPVLRKILAVIAWAALALGTPVLAASDDVQVSWRLLDYVGVDYAGAVRNGVVVSQSEYSEMREFAGSVRQRIGALPSKPAKGALAAQADKLVAAVDRKADPARVQAISKKLASALLAAYPIALAPPQLPDPDRGAKLFNETCAACHGLTGDAKTAMAAKLDPPPVAFTDRARADQRSPFALYQVIEQGIEGTAMTSFSSLPTQDRWDLAYYASHFAYPAALREQGKEIWQADAGVREIIPDLAALSALTKKD